MAAKVGLNCKMFRNTGTFITPVWNEITIARDVTLTMEADEADASMRGTTWKRRLMTLRDASIDLEIIGDTSVDDYNALRDAFLQGTVLDLAVADCMIPTGPGQYFRGDFQNFSFSRSEPLTDLVTVACNLKLTYSTNEPSFTTLP